MLRDLKIPENHQAVMPYLVLNGAWKFIRFVQAVFDGTETSRVMRDEKTIMHAEIMINESTIMFADSTSQYPEHPASLFVYVKDADAAYEKAMEEGATAVTPMADQSYGRSGGVKDPVGNTWWITSVK